MPVSVTGEPTHRFAQHVRVQTPIHSSLARSDTTLANQPHRDDAFLYR
jgi:hypothetical protein